MVRGLVEGSVLSGCSASRRSRATRRVSAVPTPPTSVAYRDGPGWAAQSPRQFGALCVTGLSVRRFNMGAVVMSLIDRFVSEECDAYVRGAIQDVVSSGTGRAVLEFNVFEIEIDMDGGKVRISDVLDGTEAGVEEVSIGDFLSALKTVKGAEETGAV